MMVIMMVMILSHFNFQKEIIPFVAKTKTPQGHLRQNEAEVC